MSHPASRLSVALADRYRVERELGAGTDAYRTEVRHRQYTVAPDDQSFLFVKHPGRNAPARTRLTTSIDQMYRAKVGRQ